MCATHIDEKGHWNDEIFNRCYVGPDDKEKKFFDIIKRDDVAAFEEYLRNSHCFTHHRKLPFVYAKTFDESGTPWTVTVNLGSIGVLEALLKYEDYGDGDYREGWDRSQPMATQWYRQILHRAIEKGQTKVFRYLIERPGADIYQRDRGEGGTPITTACFALGNCSGGDSMALEAAVDKFEEIVVLLLDSGASARDEYRQKAAYTEKHGQEVLVSTTLSLAVSRARPPLLRRLIEEGADADTPVSSDWLDEEQDITLLHTASRHHNVAAVKFLLDQPAGPAMARRRDGHQGMLPLHCAAAGLSPDHRHATGRYGDAEVTSHAVETIQALLPYNEIHERRDCDGKTALHLAAEYFEKPFHGYDASCYDPVIRLLLDHGANACVRTGRRWEHATPLRVAVGQLSGRGAPAPRQRGARRRPEQRGQHACPPRRRDE
ncbi:glycoside hydrolase family 18 protein [Apiospora saccharicola]